MGTPPPPASFIQRQVRYRNAVTPPLDLTLLQWLRARKQQKLHCADEILNRVGHASCQLPQEDDSDGSGDDDNDWQKRQQRVTILAAVEDFCYLLFRI